MNWEIELKTAVDDPHGLTQRIVSLGAKRERSYVKYDRYYRIGERVGSDSVQDFRLRVDDGRAIVTIKEKSRKNGVETNRENEFSVSDPQAFDAFVRKLGALEFITKKKTGTAFSYRGLLLELSEVETLGWYLEVEAVLDDAEAAKNPLFKSETQAKLFSVLDDLGIPHDRIEDRAYTAMLLERRGGTPFRRD